MALILEIRGVTGAPAWHRLDTLPLTLGRAPSNDIILDDPYLDARHARILLDDAGTVAIDDLGTTNGLYSGDVRVVGRALVRAGAEVRIGRTVLRFRDVDEVVAPAIVDERVDDRVASATASNGAATSNAHAVPAAPVAASAPDASTRRSLGAWIVGTAPGRLLAVGAMIAAYGVNAWLGDTSRSSGSSVFAALLALCAIVFVWSAAWAFVGRGGGQGLDFSGHLAVISLALLAVLAGEVIKEWLDFFFPDARASAFLYLAVYLVVVSALVAGHLGLASSLPRRRRWRTGMMVSGMMLVLVAMAALLKDDKFSDVPKFAADLKPVSARWIPAKSVAAFSDDARELRKEVDDAAKKEPEAEP